LLSTARAPGAALLLLILGSAAGEDVPPHRRLATPLDVARFRPVEGPSSGSAVYYHVLTDTPEGSVLQGRYLPGLETVTMGIEVPQALRQRARFLRWRWRALTFPKGGDECRAGRGDSAASVAAAFKSGLKWHILRFVWSPVSPLGAICDSRRSLFLERDTIILERDGPPGVWLTELVDLRQIYRERFEGGNPDASVPDLVGIAVMTDGDQTHSESAAEWGGFELQE
jgi:DUF3047 family protein